MPYMWNDRAPAKQADGSMSSRFNVSANGIFTLFVEEVRVPGVPVGVVAHVLVAGVSTARSFFPCRASETKEDMDAAFKKGREFCELLLVSSCAAALAPCNDSNFTAFDDLITELTSRGHMETSKKVFDVLRQTLAATNPPEPRPGPASAPERPA